MQKQFRGRKDNLFSKLYWIKTLKRKRTPISISQHIKIDSKWVIDLLIKTTIKFLKENMEKIFVAWDGLGKDFLDILPKA